MNRYGAMAAVLTAAAAASLVTPITAEASGNMELRRRVIQLSGILNNGMAGTYATRGEFASMLVNATSYRSTAGGASSTSVFADVPASSSYASAIRTASEQGWMSGYLGGVFRPDTEITAKEAARALLALLGYTDEDFSGSQVDGRWAMYNYLELGENVNRQPDEVLTKDDCVNLFYNLLRTEKKDGQAYCTDLGYELTSDGEVNPLTIADNELKGPKVVKRNEDLDDAVPFSLSEASFYLDGEFSTLERIKQEKNNGGFVVIYYNTSSKTIWAYSSSDAGDETGSSRVAVRGEVTAIYYSSSDVMNPSTVILDDYTDVEYTLADSDVQFAFSIYGEFEVGDEVILICEAAAGADGNTTYRVIDYVEY